MRVCGNCGATQGPFATLRTGDRKTGTLIVTCPIPSGKSVTPEKQKEAAAACNNRRALRDAEASKPQAAVVVEEAA